jgi:hypothetical protein
MCAKVGSGPKAAMTTTVASSAQLQCETTASSHYSCARPSGTSLRGSFFFNFWLISQKTPRSKPRYTSVEPCLIQSVDCFMDARVKSGDQTSGATKKDAIMAAKPKITIKRLTPQPTFVNISQHSLVRRSFAITSAVPARRFCTDADAAASMNDRIGEAAFASDRMNGGKGPKARARLNYWDGSEARPSALIKAQAALSIRRNQEPSPRALFASRPPNFVALVSVACGQLVADTPVVKAIIISPNISTLYFYIYISDDI